MSYQVLRVEKFLKSDLLKIGAETERTAKRHRNEDIDSGRTPLNYYFKKSEGGLSAQWKKVVKNFGASFHETKKAIAFEGIIVTSDTAFFEKLGWIRGRPTPDAVKQFFCDCYAFVLREIGYHGGDENILSAAVHMDETTRIYNCIMFLSSMKAGRKCTPKVQTGKCCAMREAPLYKQRTAEAKVCMNMCRWRIRKSVLPIFGKCAEVSYPTGICKTTFTSASVGGIN